MTLWTIVLQAPLSMGFCRQEYWRVLPCSPIGDLSDSEIEPTSLMSPALADRFFTTSATWEAHWVLHYNSSKKIKLSEVSPMVGGQENKESLKEEKGLSNIKLLYCLQQSLTHTQRPCVRNIFWKMKVGIAHLEAMGYKTATATRDGEPIHPLNQSVPRKAIRHPPITWS